MIRIGLAGLIVAATTACGLDVATYSINRYGRLPAANVTLGCRDTYEIYDRVDAFTMLVNSNVLNETLVACFDNGPPLAERQRQVAKLYLEEKSKRPLCRIVGDTELTPLQREFSYQCPANPGELPPRLPVTPRG